MRTQLPLYIMLRYQNLKPSSLDSNMNMCRPCKIGGRGGRFKLVGSGLSRDDGGTMVIVIVTVRPGLPELYQGMGKRCAIASRLDGSSQQVASANF